MQSQNFNDFVVLSWHKLQTTIIIFALWVLAWGLGLPVMYCHGGCFMHKRM